MHKSPLTSLISHSYTHTHYMVQCDCEYMQAIGTHLNEAHICTQTRTAPTKRK